MQRVADPYRVLAVSRDATVADIRAAHRRLAKRYHPDAPHADATRFLAVQDAYEILRDPLRRRDWDRRHAPGPVRAEPDGSTRRRRQATAAAPDDQTRGRGRRPTSEDAEGRRDPNDRPPGADHWTWTAEGVPWWEDSGSPGARRRPRDPAHRRARPSPGGDRGRPADPPDGARQTGDQATDPAQGASGTPPSGEARAPLGGRARGPRRGKGPADATGRPTSGARRAGGSPEVGPEARSEFDVFSRSSGAAWSSASRAYFRRRGAAMPRGAANPDTPRWTTPLGAPVPRRYGEPDATDGSPERDEAHARPVRQPRLGETLAAILRRRHAADQTEDR